MLPSMLNQMSNIVISSCSLPDLTQLSLNASLWLTHKPASLISVEVHDITVIDKHIFDLCQSCQCYMATALMKLFFLICACPVGKLTSIYRSLQVD